MREYKQFYINGEWVEPSAPKTCDVINPATEEVCAQISLGNEADVDKAVAATAIIAEFTAPVFHLSEHMVLMLGSSHMPSIFLYHLSE